MRKFRGGWMIFGIPHSFVVKEILKSLSNNSNFMNISRYVFKDTNELIYYCWSIKKSQEIFNALQEKNQAYCI